MPRKEREEIQGKAGIFRVTKFSRRQFLKSAGIVAAGAAISSISLASACKSPSGTTAETTTNVNPTSGPATSNAPISSATTPSSSLPASTSVAPTAVTPSATSTTPATSTPVSTGYYYIPPTVLPPLRTVAGTTCIVATDRVYSADHVWVKSLSAKQVVMGITATMVEILSSPYRCSLFHVDTILANGDTFGTIEGLKLTADLISPVSGTLIQINPLVIGNVGEDFEIHPLVDYPYTSGWMVVVQLSNPSELNTLLTAQSYITLVTSK